METIIPAYGGAAVGHPGGRPDSEVSVPRGAGHIGALTAGRCPASRFLMEIRHRQLRPAKHLAPPAAPELRLWLFSGLLGFRPGWSPSMCRHSSCERIKSSRPQAGCRRGWMLRREVPVGPWPGWRCARVAPGCLRYGAGCCRGGGRAGCAGGSVGGGGLRAGRRSGRVGGCGPGRSPGVGQRRRRARHAGVVLDGYAARPGVWFCLHRPGRSRTSGMHVKLSQEDAQARG